MAKDSYQIRCRILPIIWTRAQFEQRHGDITIYAKELIEKNSSRNIDVDKEDVVHIWWWLVDSMFPKGDPDREQYLAQRNCLGFHEFWLARDSQSGNHEQQNDEGFQRTRRPTTRAERRAHPGVVVLVKDGLETLVPGIEFAALKDIEYKEFVRKVLEANPTRILTLPDMQLIWDTIVHNVFAFECSCVKETKANESMGIDGFNQTQYDQLVQQVRSGAPPARPAKFIMPGSKRPRVTKATTSSSANEDDDVGAAENDSPTVQRQKRRSKRQHRSGPEDNFSVPGYPFLSSARRSAPKPRGQLPTLPNVFTRPATAPPPTPKPEPDWLDPQLLSGPAIQLTGKAAASSSYTSKRLGTKEVENEGGDSMP